MRLLDLYYDFKELFWGPCTAPWGKKNTYLIGIQERY